MSVYSRLLNSNL